MKRVFDLILAPLLLVALAPVVLIIAMAILVGSGRPVFFRQLRPGKDGNPFELIKFRTMTAGSSPDKDRITRLGRFLRETSLDELPELINVARGEMSLVGPRPLLMEYLRLYTSEQARRHEVRPGITGWAQVNGRNSLSWEDRFALDVWYVDNQSFWLDMKILLLTVRQVFRRDGISAEGEATMHRFTGSDCSERS